MDRNERVEQMRQEFRNRQNPQRQAGEPPPRETPEPPRPRRQGNRYGRLAFFPVSILWMELILRLWSNQPFGGLGLLYVLLFSIGAGMVCNLLASFGPERLRRALHCAILIFLTLLFGIQVVFYNIFRGYAEFSALGVAGAVISDFFMDMLRGIGASALPLLLLFFPLALLTALQTWKRRPIRRRGVVRALVIVVVFHVLVISSVLLNTYGILSPRAIYREHFTITLATENFGLVTSMRLDLRYMLFGRPEMDFSEVDFTPTPGETTPAPTSDPNRVPEENGYPHDEAGEPEPVIPLGFAGCYYNILPIDFEALIETESNATVREMHEFFMNRRATPRNEWTGRFEGYNLIWIMGEAFHTVALHPEITPTLYRIANEGFQFTNFYTPHTGLSTMGGEYAMKLSLVPRGRTAFQNTARLYMPFGFGNMFRDLGYETFAYHNWTYTFNDRHLTHPNLGYPWSALGGPAGNALPIARTWPTSDLEMIELTVGDFANADNFMVYYVTMSGHQFYTFSGNNMAARHREQVAHLPYSEGPQAYLATHIELDLAVQYLIDRLDEAGQLERTVFAIVGDHYPYGLTDAEIGELMGAPMTVPRIERYQSTFVLWSPSMEEPVQVDTFSSSYDVMPTLANLFNLPFDSRLVMGVDILSGVDPFVLCAHRSWISQLGVFNAQTGNFTPHPHIDPATIPENHVQQMWSRFNIMETFSTRIIENDYYRRVLGG